ncbi:hypothetical protein SDC9_106986 [bioreactor metagenome]|uniref:Uncharacterized protein n=1 Tax=bioreactor metagenome TaxID=1076179 RepID=A0A645B3X8_9ZZZZ
MDRDGADARLLQKLCHLHGVQMPHVPTPSNLRRHRHGAGLYYGLGYPGGILRILHQGGAVPVARNLSHGTAHVDVNHIRTGELCRDLRRLRHTGGVAAEDLHRKRVFSRKGSQQAACFLILIAQGLGGNQLRVGIARAKF